MENAAKITVKGYGSVSAMPDGIQIDLTVIARAAQYAPTLGDLNTRVGAIQAALSRAMTSEPAKTKSYEIEEVWTDRYDEDKRKFEGYKATQILTLTIPLDQALLGRVMVELAASASQPSISFSFVIRDSAPLKRAARIAAVVQAKEAASDLATAAGLRLVSVTSIDYAGTSNTKASTLRYSSLAQYDAPSTPDATPDVINLDETVHMVWEAVPHA